MAAPSSGSSALTSVRALVESFVFNLISTTSGLWESGRSGEGMALFGDNAYACM
jgi:hypothetical protein